ncbi:acyltransferase family protein [Micromonospora sp. CA-269861]|uniref:acyltransferase family protein n=1 Tax=Micromonospora sp. CA-269861 TaxID=3239968 RepID=UPI003D90E333
MTSTATPVRQQHRLYEVDLLRFAAALMVVLLHFTFSQGQLEHDFAPALGAVTQYGYLGVELFFLISGMVVLMSVWGRTTREFVASRISRLYPAFWVAVTLTAATVAIARPPGRNDVTAAQYVANLSMFPQLADIEYVESVYWTLWSEWRFYLILFAFSLLGITERRTHWLLWGWLTTSVALQVLPVPPAAHAALALIVQPQFSHYFIAGMALYLVHRFGFTARLGLLLLACYANAVKETGSRIDERVADGQAPILVVAALVILAIFIVMTLAATGGLRWMRWPVLSELGAMTYPLYLIHFTLGVVAFNAVVPAVHPWLALPLVIAAMCGASWLISAKVEDRVRPALHLAIRRLLRVPPRRMPQQTASTARAADQATAGRT